MPAWLRTLEKLPLGQAIGISIVAVSAFSITFVKSFRGEVPITLNSEWKQLEQEQRKLHNMDPIFGTK